MDLKKHTKRLFGAFVLGAVLLAIAWAGGGSPGGTPTAFATIPCPDVDGDGVVTPADIAVVTASLGSIPPLPIQADATADGFVTVADVAFVTGALGLITPCQVKPYIDTDLDGCTDIEERGPVPGLGGGRSPASFWDFYDTPTAAGMKDLTVNIFDVMRVATHFGSAGPVAPPGSGFPGDPLLLPPPPFPIYHSSYDRTAAPGPFLTGIADGVVGVVPDVLRVAAQFGHTCVAPP